MTRPWRHWMRRVALGTATISLLLGSCGMKNSKSTTTLTWEWPAGRKPDARIAARVAQLEEKGPGLFGIGRSPSIAGNLPDPIRLVLELLTKSDVFKTPSIELTVPQKEIPGIERSDRIALGLVQSKTCICIAKIPSDVANLDEWLSHWSCGGK